MGDGLVRIGTETSGDPAYACRHMAQWWPHFEAIVEQDLGVGMEIIQALGDATASAGTHGLPGTALDLRTWRFPESTVLKIVARARKYGAPATWYRSRLQGFDPHIHLVLDCPCSSPADYQISAVKRGYNGLGSGGYGGPDYHPKPDAWRDYSAGIALMEEDMALSDADVKKVAAAAADEVWGRLLMHPDGDEVKRIRADQAHYWDRRAIDRIAAKVGAPVDVDEEAIASSVVEQLAPDLRAAVADVVRESLDGVSDDAAGEIADQVVSKLVKLNAA